ncbi:MAG: flippase-like domain-containing protein [Candidatus Aminicenantes bacterium]|nr:flippase-like domain-containing protein [Candidatus Aminicenantes bacterium]NIM85024.1 flippase-like domain-containing protein [Candidatus Aminicenantes bacterium]NIN24538.1 flippase-like domain-containing protein [Candidatus Aminicenantes bacterium]NIN48302.1 flippase-like domain-containing protein [Candidatus Aminicenantes bacterium]NIN91205.1 flippase-like domain-containing protein [Candidatus Aminicenantes bacterium]
MKKQTIVRLSVLIGLLIFAFFVYKIGPVKIWENIKQISWQNFLILMGLRFLYWVLRTINWKVIFEAYEGKTSLWDMYTARMCSHAINQLTPSAQVGGEAARVYLVNYPNKRVSLASVIVDKTIEFITVIVFIIIGVAMTITRFTLPGKLKAIFIGAVVSAFLLLVFLLSKQKKGLFEWMVNALAKMKIHLKFFEKNKEKIKETDEYISDFYQKHPGTFVKAFLLYSLLIMLWVTEIHVTLVFIGAINISFLDSFLITVLGTLAFIFPLIPGSLGIYEATYVGLFALLGKGTSIGFTLVLIRRILALIWAGIGLLGMLKPFPGKPRRLE